MNKIKKLLSLAIVLCMIFIVLPMNAFAATAIEIGTAEELRKIGRDSAYPLSGSYVLTADIDVSGEEWVPIGLDSLTDTSASDFTGTINGQGHVIKGMWNEDRTDADNPVHRTIASKHWGFIAKMKSGTIKNLAFSDIYFNIGKAGNNEVYIAGVVGYLGSGKVTIDSVAVLSGKIDATNFAHILNMAGIATSYGASSGSAHTITNCYNAAELHAFSTVYSKYSSYASVAGIFMSAYYDNARNTVENCLNVGKIYLGSNTTSTWQNFAGNIVSRREEKTNTATCKAVLNNNYAVDSLLNISYGIQLSTDVETTNIVYAVDAGKADSYSGLTAVTDADGNAAWTVQDGKYPILSSFDSYAKDAVVANYTPSLSQGFLANEGYLAERYDGYTLVKDYNFLTDEYQEIACNPIRITTLAKQDINSTNGTSLTYAKTNVYDNRLIDYNTQVFSITAKPANGYSGIYAFMNNTFAEDENGYNDLWGWVSNNGDMRFYIKNDSDESLTFRPYIYFSTTSKYHTSLSGTAYSQMPATSYITLEANSGWVEIRLPYSAFSPSTSAEKWIGKGKATSFRIGLQVTEANGFLNTSGGTVYMSDPEFHNHTILSPVTTDFDRPYVTQSVVGANYSWKVDNTGNIARTFADCTELPFITKATTFTASDTYDYSALASNTQLGVFLKYSNLTANIDKWAINPNAEMRFWVKSKQDSTFTMTIQLGDKNAYTTVNITGKEGWQEIRIKSSAFTNVANIEEQALAASDRDVYLSITVKKDTFVAEQSIVFGNRLEFFSDKAYDKGDANRDGAVDVKDLVHVKKLAAADASDFINCDIDADGKLAATDITYFRKWMLFNNWYGSIADTVEQI